MIMWRCFLRASSRASSNSAGPVQTQQGQFKLSRASSNSAGPVQTQQGQFKNTSGPVKFLKEFRTLYIYIYIYIYIYNNCLRESTICRMVHMDISHQINGNALGKTMYKYNTKQYQKLTITDMKGIFFR